MSVAMKRSLSSTHTPSDYQPGLYAPSSRMRHHRRSVDRVWPPALEMKLAQLSMDEGRQPDCQLFFATSKSLPSSTTSRLGGAHIIPAPPPLDSEDHEHDDDRDTDDGMDHRSRGEDRRRRRASCDFPLTPSSIHYPRTSISVQYCKQSRKSPASSPFLSPSSLTHSPRRFPGGLEGFTKIVDSDDEPEIDYRSTVDLALGETMPDSNSDSDPDQEDSHQRQNAYTPPPRRRYINSPRAAAAVIPQGFTFTFAQPDARPQPRSRSQTRSRPHSHYSSTGGSSATSSPALSRRNSGTTSPRTFILQGFLARHSNGHIMHRRPTKCSSECSSPTSSSNDNGSVSGDEVGREEGGYEDEDEDDDDDHDDRFMLLAQSPNSSEFDFAEFLSERQTSTRKYQADSPVFFNGFPLLQMTPMKR
ncbi:unnamed protein product [Mortierella alpina]